MDPSEYECAICQNLLLDPVVGPCGHDYCQFCLWRWRTTSKSARSTTVACPLCREPIPGELGVCVRLRETIQRFFPEEVKRRRVEVQERKQVLDAEVASQQAVTESSQRITTAHHASPSREVVHASSSAQHVSRWALSRQRTRPMPRSPPAGTSASAEQPAPSSAQPGPSEAMTTGASDTWMPPATLCFTLGWYDPAETRGRRSLGRRRRVMAA